MPKTYYPARARWYSPAVYRWFWLRRALRLDRINFASAPGVMAGLFLPGYAFAAYGRPTIARAVAAGYLVTGAVFFVWLGYFISKLALGVMISLHVVSVLYLIGRQEIELSARWRVALSLAVFALVYFGVYFPLQGQFEQRLARPLRVGNKLVMIGARKGVESVKRGDWVAYRIDGVAGDHLHLEDGFGFGQVQAMGGERIVFSPGSFQINAAVFSRRPFMPIEGTWVVPEKHWFIWPDSVMSNAGDHRLDDSIAQLMRQVAMVGEPQYAGKPLRHWFWRRQNLP